MLDQFERSLDHNNNNNNNNNSEVLLGANIHRPDAPYHTQTKLTATDQAQ